VPKDCKVILGLLDKDGIMYEGKEQFWLPADEYQSGMWSTDPFWGDPPTHWKPCAV